MTPATLDRTGQVWLVWGSPLLVLGPPAFTGYSYVHPCLHLETGERMPYSEYVHTRLERIAEHERVT